MKSVKEQLKVIQRGAFEIISEEELVRKLQAGRPLVIKAGFDPTAPDLHLGHTVLLNKLRQFQDLGHNVVFLIGDFTGMIGDPSGVSETRKALTKEEVKENARTYEKQVFKVLERDKTIVRFNSEWLSQMSAMAFAELGAKQTVARMLERDDFKKRFKENRDISILEFYYPLLQGYDSVVLKADVEVGGTDQRFNLLMGRTLQKRYGQEPQIVITMPLLEGTDGVKKMSKTYGNYVGIQDEPLDMFGKILSISDELMWRYFELLSCHSVSEISDLKQQVRELGRNPKEVKVMLASELVARFHGKDAADHAAREFENIFKKKVLPEAIEAFRVSLGDNGAGLLDVMTKSGLTSSNGEARRLIRQGGVKIDQEKVSDPKMVFKKPGEHIIQAGKRRFRRVIFSR